MAANVLMENDRYADLANEIARADPDVLFLMETDADWSVGLSEQLDRYPTVLRHPKDNHYGLILATRLKVRDMRVRYLTADDTPTAFAELETPDGQVFRFVGMHPQPPVPGVDTEERDAQIAYAARFARDASLPVVVMGDFNAVAWSDVSESFKTVGEYLDPRVGRGPIPSFDATNRLMRFPIDQMYVTEDVAVVQFGRGTPFGSDHFPMLADLSFDADLAARYNRPKPPFSAERERQIRRMVDAHAENLKSVHGAPQADTL
ncbi:endonuclease/exonuclease/phosphatase family protein [Oceaniglobus indicus]|uniref:endonuclease/exonuclease/phosphatase family protein n=1 Tax=Oceaniglobus indicus TaxID=2047749 RepID=UPI000C188535|nr:endonuclease/exonuclease/phosphatase family protein [Oceaniglobus indicus]